MTGKRRLNYVMALAITAVLAATGTFINSSEKARTTFEMLISDSVLLRGLAFLYLLSILVLLVLGYLLGLRDPFPIMTAAAIGTFAGSYSALFHFVGRYGTDNIASVEIAGTATAGGIAGFFLGFFVMLVLNAQRMRRRLKQIEEVSRQE
jgi:phosphate/sulfate permease